MKESLGPENFNEHYNESVDLPLLSASQQLLSIPFPDGRNGCLQLRADEFNEHTVQLVQEAVAVLAPVFEWREDATACADITSSLSAAARAGAIGVQEAAEAHTAIALAAAMIVGAVKASQCWVVLCEDGWWASGAAIRIIELEDHTLKFPGVLVTIRMHCKGVIDSCGRWTQISLMTHPSLLR